MRKPVKVTQETLDRLGVVVKERRPITEEEMQRARDSPALPSSERRLRRKAYVTLDPLAHQIAKKLGKGIVSHGIDKALFAYQERQEAERAEKRVVRKFKRRPKE